MASQRCSSPRARQQPLFLDAQRSEQKETNRPLPVRPDDPPHEALVLGAHPVHRALKHVGVAVHAAAVLLGSLDDVEKRVLHVAGEFSRNHARKWMTVPLRVGLRNGGEVLGRAGEDDAADGDLVG